MAPEKTPRRLGRGLDALLGQKRADPQTAASNATNTTQPAQPVEESALRELPISAIRANQYQPRKTFKNEELDDLRNSIRSSGLLQPITVRQIVDQAGYELVAGERRLRAAQQLGWTSIPALVRDYDDQTMLTLALIENLQRADLNPIEEAEGYSRLAIEFSLTQNEIAEIVGKDRSTVANLLRILQLPHGVRKMIEGGELTAGHARPLLALDGEDAITKLATDIVQLGLSVRAVEDRVRADSPKNNKPKRGRPQRTETKLTEVKYVEDRLRSKLQTDVSINIKKDQQGEVAIQFYSFDDLNRILEIMDALE